MTDVRMGEPIYLETASEARMPWRLTIDVNASDFDLLKWQAEEVLKGIAKAKGVRELPIGGSSALGVGNAGPSCSFSVKWTSPVEDRIALLRKEADELEATLGKK